ncbi:MAG: RNA polymerase sigma factor [Myxococcota bacterium]
MTSPAHPVLLAPAGSLADQTALALDFDLVYREHARFVWRSLSRLGVAPEHLADAMQDVFIVVHRKLPSFEGRSSVRTWLFGIAMRVASDWARRVRRHPSEPLVDTIQDARENAPFERAARSEALSTLHRLLDELSPDQRAVFVLVELEQMSIAEAASAVSANIHTTTSRLKVARQKFEAALRRHRASDGRSPP